MKNAANAVTKVADVKGNRVWMTGRSRRENAISWNHGIGVVTTSVRGQWLGRIESMAGFTWAEIKVQQGSRPTSITVDFAINLESGIIPFFCKGGEVIDCADGRIPSLIVPVKWRQFGSDRKWAPHTRVQDQDNIDLVLRNQGGDFIDLQISVVTRGGRFFLSIQELSSGTVVRLLEGLAATDYREVVVGDGRFITVPLLEEHAYPGADWLRSIMPRSGPAFIAIAAEDKAFLAVTDLEVAEWIDVAYPAEANWVGARVLWFNPLIGGKVLCADGVTAFVPLRVIPIIGTESDPKPTLAMQAGEFAPLLPAQMALVQFEEAPKGRSVTAIRPIW